jgi:hypothetical protein
MKTLRLTLVAVAMLAANITFASDGKITPPKEKSTYYLSMSCMDRAMMQIEVGVNIAYQTMLSCGVYTECTIGYNNTINTLFAFVENSYNACTGIGQAFSADNPNESPLSQAMKSK